jgi:hypothetical protein
MITVTLIGDDLLIKEYPDRREVTGFLTPADARALAAELILRADQQDSHQLVEDESETAQCASVSHT